MANLLHKKTKPNNKNVKATPHKACAKDAPTDFSSDCIEIPQAYYRMSRDFSSVLVGDINNDGRVNTEDVDLICSIDAGVRPNFDEFV